MIMSIISASDIKLTLAELTSKKSCKTNKILDSSLRDMWHKVSISWHLYCEEEQVMIVSKVWYN